LNQNQYDKYQAVFSFLLDDIAANVSPHSAIKIAFDLVVVVLPTPLEGWRTAEN